MVITTLSISISVKYTGDNLTKETLAARQREALPFPLFNATSNYILEKIL